MRDSLDARISAAMQEVFVPESLAERILARTNLPSHPAANQPARFRGFQRRWVVFGFGLTAAAALLLAAIWLGGARQEPLSQQQLLFEAVRWFTNVLEDDLQLVGGESAVAVRDFPPAAEYPPSEKVPNALGAHWQPLRNFLNLSGVVYYLDGLRGVRGVLFVVAGKVSELSYLPPATPFSTGGCSAAAWQEEALTYILVVRGGVGAYRSFLNLPRSPLALSR